MLLCRPEPPRFLPPPPLPLSIFTNQLEIIHNRDTDDNISIRGLLGFSGGVSAQRCSPYKDACIPLRCHGTQHRSKRIPGALPPPLLWLPPAGRRPPRQGSPPGVLQSAPLSPAACPTLQTSPGPPCPVPLALQTPPVSAPLQRGAGALGEVAVSLKGGISTQPPGLPLPTSGSSATLLPFAAITRLCPSCPGHWGGTGLLPSTAPLPP